MKAVHGPEVLFRWILVLAVAVVSLPSDVFSLEPGRQSLAPHISSWKTMTRSHDFVVVHGSELKENRSKEISTLALIASVNGRIQPIPFQVDEINRDGDWVLPRTPPYLENKEAQVDRDEDNGRLDNNDELVFMIRDTGDRLHRRYLPEGAEDVDEIMLEDPDDHGRSWVYLCSFVSEPPKSDKDYANYLLPRNRVVTPSYELGFSLEVPISWDYISIMGCENLIDRLKLRFDLKVFGIRYGIDETQFLSTLSSYKDGPIRVIRRVRSSISLVKFFKTPSVSSETIYYDNSVVIPYRIKLPVSPAPFKRLVKIRMRGGEDMQNLHGWRVKTDVDPQWLNIDGKMDATEKSIVAEDIRWFFLAGPEQCLLKRAILDKKLDGSPQVLPIKTSLFYVDDDNTSDPPEFVPGQSPNIGYWLERLNELPKGVTQFHFISYMIKEGYRRGIEDEYLKIMDRPVRVSVNPLH